MNPSSSWQNLQQSLHFLQKKCSLKPRVAIVLGSGLGNFADNVEVVESIPFKEIPHFSATTVPGHKGHLIFGYLSGKSAKSKVPILVLQGRNHFYEGHSAESVIFPVRLSRLLGAEILLLTNSAGGLSATMNPGDFMAIEDHMNLTGTNPLIGPNLNELGPRFPDMTDAYDPQLTKKLARAFEDRNLRLHYGVYAGLTGPTYETPAEVRHLQLLGAGAVGMSTVWECIAGVHCGMKVVGVSCISNLAAGIAKHKLSHDEVTSTGQSVAVDFAAALQDFIGHIDNP
jgi:purine-nucleoside phosphorylase